MPLENVVDAAENPEGILVDGDTVTLINDNHFKVVTGPSVLTTLAPNPALAVHGGPGL